MALVALIAFGRWARELLVPLALSGLLFVALRPPTTWLIRLRFPRALAALIPLVLLVVGGARLAQGLNDQAVEVLEDFPRMMETVRSTIRGEGSDPQSALQKLRRAADEIQSTAEVVAQESGSDDESVRVVVERAPGEVGMAVLGGSVGVIGSLAEALLVLILAYFLQVEAPSLRRAWIRLSARSFGARRASVRTLDAIAAQLQRFLLVMAFSCTTVATVTWVLLRFAGLERAAFWGVVAGILNLVPYVGPLFASLGVTLAGFMQFGDLRAALAVGGLALVVTSLEGWLLTPWLLGRAGRLSHTGIFVGLLFWSWLWGLWGVLLAGPLTLSIRAMAEQQERWRAFARLLSAQARGPLGGRLRDGDP